jgi:cytochrome P450
METAADVVNPGAYWMESIPEMIHLPAWLYPLPSRILTQAKLYQRYFYSLSKEGARAQEPNFAKTILKEQEIQGLSNNEVAGLTANLIGGGVDTTSGTLTSFILAMCVFPEVQKKAQEELDSVVGQDRSPTWSDEENLPYLLALLKELFRWRSVAVLGGIPHAPIQDDYYRGYYIPKGATITGNLWAIHRNPREFPEPDVFRPERYLNGGERPYPNSRGHNAFGWGRRQCSGQPLAEQGLFITLARMLWTFNISTEVNEKVQYDSYL